MAVLKPKKIKYKMDDETFRSVVHRLATDARRYVDETLQPSRILATQYYNGKAFGDENVDESSIVITTIRDKINGVLPSLFNVYASSETAVEYTPRNELEVEMCEEATDAINHIFWNECDGFTVLDAVFQDALIRKSGIFYWYFENEAQPRNFVYKGLTDDEMDHVLSLPGHETMEIVEKLPADADKVPSGREADPQDPLENPAMQAELGDVLAQIAPEAAEAVMAALAPVPTYDFRVKQIVVTPRVRIDAIPPEQYIISRSATSERNAVCQGRQQIVTVSDLVSVGLDKDEILENRGATPAHGVSASNMEAQEHNPGLLYGRDDQAGDESLTSVLYSELFVKIDRDGDGIAELWRVETIGTDHYVLRAEVFEETQAPFAILCPYPDGKSPIGMSLADRLVDLQEINSRVWRAMLDSLTQAIYSRTVIAEGRVNIDDVLNTEPGAIIRAQDPQAVQEFSHQFVGAQATQVLMALNDMAVERTGITPASYLDADAMQSTTRAAVDATTSAQAQANELIARRFGENAMKRMFAGLLRMVCRHIDQPLDVLKRDGSMGRVDPRTWSPELMTSVNVGLGRGNDQQRAQTLDMVMGWQQQVVAAVGPNGPVGPNEMRNAMAKRMQSGGIKDVAKFIKPIPAGWQPPAPKAGADPQMALAQGQIENDRMKLDIEMKKLEIELLKIQMDDAFRREELANQMVLKRDENVAHYGSQLQQAQMDAEIDIEKHRIGVVGQHVARHAEHAHQAEQASLDRAHALDKHHLDSQAAHHASSLQAEQSELGAQRAAEQAAQDTTPNGDQP